MNISVTYKPEITNAEGFKSRVVGVSSPVIFEYAAQGQSLTALSYQYIDGGLFAIVDAAPRSALNVNDIIKLDFAGNEFTTRVISIDEDPAVTGQYLIELNYSAGDIPDLSFVLVSPADFAIETIIKAEGKTEFTLISRLDINGVATVDIAPALLQYLRTLDNFNYSDDTFKEPLNSIEFTVSYQALADGEPLQRFDIDGVYLAVLATNQNQNINDSNLIEYVPTGAQPLAKYLNTYKGKAPAFFGFPFWLDAIFDNAIQSPEIEVNGDNLGIDISEGRGVYRISGRQSWIDGQHEVCATTTGTGDGVEPPPISQSVEITSYHFRGSFEAQPAPPIDGSTCGQFFITDSKKTGSAYYAINTTHPAIVLPPNEILIYNLDATAGAAGVLPCWQFIAEQLNGGWAKLATSARFGAIDGPFTGDLSVFDSSTFPTCDGFISNTGFPPVGNRLADLNALLTSLSKPNINPGQFASAKQWLWYHNDTGQNKTVALWQIVPPLNKKYVRLTAFAQRVCP